MTEYFTITSRDLSSMDTDNRNSTEEHWVLTVSSMCQAALEHNFVSRPPLVILDNRLIMPVDPASITTEGADTLFSALVDGWESDKGIVLVLDGHVRTFKYSACKPREIMDAVPLDSTSDEPVKYTADVLSIRAYENQWLDAVLAAFIALLPLSASITYPSSGILSASKKLREAAAATADMIIAERNC